MRPARCNLRAAASAAASATACAAVSDAACAAACARAFGKVCRKPEHGICCEQAALFCQVCARLCAYTRRTQVKLVKIPLRH